MRTAYNCRAYPGPEQAHVLNRTFGCVRVAWNQTLAWRRQRYQADKAGTTYSQASAYLTAMKATEELTWLNEVSSVPLQQAIRHQQAAYAAFFAGQARYPRFKSRDGRQCAEYTRSGFRWHDGALFLAKMGTPLAFTWSWPSIDPASIDPTTVTVSRDPCGRWYVAFAVEVPAPDPLPANGRAVGVDLGVKEFVVTSDEQRIPNPRHLERRARSVARYQRRMARCQPGSANRAKAKGKAARAHRRVRAARADFLHKTSTGLVRDHDLICLEDLAVKNMVKNRRVARAISDCGWGTFREMLEYKAAPCGRRVIVIDRWFPSSKMCSACGHVLAELSLDVRHWMCPSCGTRHDRDINAAKNILAAGLAVAGDTFPGHACGADVRHPGSPGCSRAVKQEPQGVSPESPPVRAESSQLGSLPPGPRQLRYLAMGGDAAAEAAGLVAAVRDDPARRLQLASSFYDSRPGRPSIGAYRRAEVAFMRWQVRRGLLAAPDSARPGSAWWRSVNEGLLRDAWEADRLAAGRPGPASRPSVSHWAGFLRRPSATSWYRAHNASIVAGYLRHQELCAAELPIERFFMNVTLSRVLYAHALVTRPKLALGRMRGVSRPLGDPRWRGADLFLSLRNILPDRYPLDGITLSEILVMENHAGRLIDYGVIVPRLQVLFEWAAADLGEPQLLGLIRDGLPAYAWTNGDRHPWTPVRGRRIMPVLTWLTSA